MTPWARPRFSPTGRRARIERYALLHGARIEPALELARERIDDDDLWHQLNIEICSRDTDLGRLDEAISGRAAHAIEMLPPHVSPEVDRCKWYAALVSDIADPPHAGLLQVTMEVLHALAHEQDLLYALDVATARWWSPEELAAPRPFAIDDHVRVVAEAVERRPGVGHLVRSRGLQSFARPDVAARVPKPEIPVAAELLHELVTLLSEGETLAAGDRLRAEGRPALTFVARSDDALVDAPAATAPLYELRDLYDDGAGPSLTRFLAAMINGARGSTDTE